MCFDPAAASSPTRVVSLAAVVDLLEREPHAPDVIEGYRERMREGTLFPPVAVLPLFGRYVVTDGHKRLSAFRGLGERELVVEVWGARRFLADQLAQAGRNARKNRQILRSALADPRESRRLLASTFGHWRRVARALGKRLLPNRA